MQIDLSINKVTTLSKILALFILVTFPLFGFWLGIRFQQSITPACLYDVLDSSKFICNTNKGVSNGIVDVEWKFYSIEQLGLTIQLPPAISKLNPEIVVHSDEVGTKICFEVPELQSFDLIKNAFAGDSSCNMGWFGIGSRSSSYKNYKPEEVEEFSDLSGYQTVPRSFSLNKVNDMYSGYTNKNGINMLIVKGSDRKDADFGSVALEGTPGEGYIGAIMNSYIIDYPGITTWIKLQGELNEEMFM